MGTGHILPLEVVDKCIGRHVHVLMKGDKEFYGVLEGFDHYMNMVLQGGVKELSFKGQGSKRSLIS